MLKMKKNITSKKKNKVNLTNSLPATWDRDKKKIRILKERPSKKDQSSIIKKNIKKPELTRVDFTNLLSE